MKTVSYSSSKCIFLVLIAAIVFSMCCGAALGLSGQMPNADSEKEIQPSQRIKIDPQRFREAMRVHNRNIHDLMNISGVFATSTGIGSDGNPVIKVYTSKSRKVDIPSKVEGLSVVVKSTGRFRAFATTDRFPRPVPIGVSTGHPDITAGTIGARVTDGTNVFALSNNHVYANSNNASIGDDILQPGPYDGGAAPDDVIGALFAFKQIEYCNVYWGGYYYSCPQTNTMDAAIADVIDQPQPNPW